VIFCLSTFRFTLSESNIDWIQYDDHPSKTTVAGCGEIGSEVLSGHPTGYAKTIKALIYTVGRSEDFLGSV
jgi:hypothetical protein